MSKMPCYDGSREDERMDRETAKKVEAVLYGAVRTFGFDNVLDLIHWGECGVTTRWFEGWWNEHLIRSRA